MAFWALVSLVTDAAAAAFVAVAVAEQTEAAGEAYGRARDRIIMQVRRSIRVRKGGANYARKDPREKERKIFLSGKGMFCKKFFPPPPPPPPLRYGGDAGMVHEVVLKICSLFLLLLLLLGLPKYALFEGKAIVSRSGGDLFSFLPPPPFSHIWRCHIILSAALS